MNELKHFSGRSGVGAIMGRKRLRGIVVRKHTKLEPKDPEGLTRCAQRLREHYDRNTNFMHAPFGSGPLAGVRIDPESYARALRLYCRMEGREPEMGWPTFTKLAELGIE